MAIPKLDLSVGSTQTIYDWAGLTNDVIDAMNGVDEDIDALITNVNAKLVAQNTYVTTTLANFSNNITSNLNTRLQNQDTLIATQLANQNNYITTSTNASNILTKLKTVDGVGSGLDADLLDGQTSTYFTNIPARLGYTPANQANTYLKTQTYSRTEVDSIATGLSNTAATNRTYLEGKLPPIGSYLITPKYAIPPNAANWLPAKGQILSRASYPELSAAIPPVPKGFRSFGPHLKINDIFTTGINGNGGTANAPFNSAAIRDDGTIITSQTNFLRYLTPSSVENTAAINLGINSSTQNAPFSFYKNSMIFRGDDLLHISSGDIYNFPATFSLNGTRTLQVDFATEDSGYTNMYKLSNGNILAIGPGGTNQFAIRRLITSAAASSANWSGVNLPSSTIFIKDFMVWYDNSSRFYIAYRAQQSNAYFVARTVDGVAWTSCGTLPGSQNMTFDQQKVWLSSMSSFRPIRKGYYESANGQTCAIEHNNMVFYSNDAGNSWNFKTVDNIFSPSGPSLSMYSDNMVVEYDKKFNYFIVATYHTVASNAPAISIRTTTDFISFNTLLNAQLLGGTSQYSNQIVETRMFTVNNKIYVHNRSGSSYYRYIYDRTPGTIQLSYGGATQWETELINYPYSNGRIFISNANDQYLWTDEVGIDVEEEVFNGTDTGNGSFLFITMNNICNKMVSASNGILRMGMVFGYNPTTDIKIPQVTHLINATNPTSGSILEYNTQSTNSYTGFAYYIRVR